MKGLTDYQKFLVLRPLPPNTETDEFGNPVLKKDDYSDIDWDDVKFTSYSNIASIKNNKRKYIPFLFLTTSIIVISKKHCCFFSILISESDKGWFSYQIGFF